MEKSIEEIIEKIRLIKKEIDNQLDNFDDGKTLDSIILNPEPVRYSFYSSQDYLDGSISQLKQIIGQIKSL